MEDPVFNATITVGGNGSTYRFDALSKMMHSNQSFILELTFIKPSAQGGGAYDISGSVATLFVSTVNNSDPNNVFTLDGGVLSDSGSGTTDRVTFTVVKDLIPDSLGGVPFRSLNQGGASTGGNSVFYFILEDADSILEFSEGVNIIDPNFAGPGTVIPGAGSIVVSKNDLGSVLDIALTTPPAADLGVNYIVPASGVSGVWIGHENEYATGNGTDWLFTIPVDGNFVFNETTNLQTRFNAGVWFVDTDLVTSVFTRTGDVVFEAGDATAALITNVPAGNIVAIEVQAAITELDAQDTAQQVIIDVNSAHLLNTSDPHNVTALQVENFIAQWNADKLLGKTIAAAASTPSQGDVLIFNTSTQEWEPGTVSAGASGRPAFECVYDNTIDAADPATGAVKFNDLTPANVTTIRNSITDANGVPITNQLSTIGSGDAFIVWQINDKTKWGYYSVTSSALATGAVSYDIVCSAILGGGVAFDNGASVGIQPYILTVGGATGVSFVNGRAGNVTLVLGDTDSDIVADASLFGGPTVEDSFNAVFNTLSPFAVAAGVDNVQAGVAYTLVLTDKDNTNIVMTSASSNEITIPTNASVALPLAVKIPYLQKGVGVTTITGDTGVTVNGVSGGSVVVNNRYQGGVMWQITANDWVIPGDVT